MIELTYGELKDALFCCTVCRDCALCPLYRGDDLGPTEDCTYHLMSAAMNCINVMEKDFADANKRAEMLEGAATANEKALFELYESIDRGGKK